MCFGDTQNMAIQIMESLTLGGFSQTTNIYAAELKGMLTGVNGFVFAFAMAARFCSVAVDATHTAIAHETRTMPCETNEHGETTSEVLTQHASAADPASCRWVRLERAFSQGYLA